MKTEDTEVLGRELNWARSKPDTVDRHVRTARIFVHHYNSTLYCKTDSFLYIPLPPDQHHISYQPEYTAWIPWRIRHCTLASHLTCLNCNNNMNTHRLCDLPLLFNSRFHEYNPEFGSRAFRISAPKIWNYCLLVSVILHHSLHFVAI